ncbi:hypothetical protein [Mesorhizobium sp. B2-3-4]|uniref:hypothetical protein n=1 Tax=Mesorhizobium sp. B2-3-4 TaxID=2589959 RepID=UPI001127C1F3|nr:hypothetical protein [Mesorhizobium sp. B2-3-4]TPM37092.1 hypothetical protein FJ967_16525 [Mesorhizobium sp. B2-3-4]
MTQFTSLVQEIMPSWLCRRSVHDSNESEPDLASLRPRDADDIWRQIVEKNLFGANTQDYAQTGDKMASRH